MRALTIYRGSDAEATTRFYAELGTRGEAGVVAVNLMRAMKASARAKQYRGPSIGEAYAKKDWSIAQLCKALETSAEKLRLGWGWKYDPNVPLRGNPGSWIVYVDLPHGQVSFHTSNRLSGPEYAGEWDGAHASESRIIAYAELVFRLPIDRLMTSEEIKDLIDELQVFVDTMIAAEEAARTIGSSMQLEPQNGGRHTPKLPTLDDYDRNGPRIAKRRKRRR